MWFSASTKHFVGMNRFGKLEKIIDLGDRFILHHDYALDDDGNIVSLATDLTRSDHAVQDQAIKVNTSTGKVTKLVDFGEMFPDYKAATPAPMNPIRPHPGAGTGSTSTPSSCCPTASTTSTYSTTTSATRRRSPAGHDEKARRPRTGGRRAFSRCGPMRMRQCRYYRSHGTF